MIDWTEEEEVKAEAIWLFTTMRCPNCRGLAEATVYASSYTKLVSLFITCHVCHRAWERDIVDWLTGTVFRA